MTELTLIVTAHRVRYLSEALASVLDQDNRDFEVILVADTLGDQEVGRQMSQFLRRWRSNGARGRLLRVQGGSAGAVRNAGVAVSQTEWISYLDGDDVLSPAAMKVALECAGPDVDLISTGQWHIRGTETVPIPRSSIYRPTVDLYLEDPEIADEPVYLHQLVIFRRALWDAYPWYEGGPGGEDLDFMLHHLLVARFRKVPDLVYGHRRVPDGFSNRAGREAGNGCSCPCSVRYRTGYYRELLAHNLTEVGCENLGIMQ